MDNYAELSVGDQKIYVEIAPVSRESWQEAGIKEKAEEVKMAFDQMMGTVRTAAIGFVDGVKKLEKKVRPDEATIEFGLTFGKEVGIAVKGTSEAAFKISLTWKTSEGRG
jgi:hypothetical protein